MPHSHKSGSSVKPHKHHREGGGVKRKMQLANVLAVGLILVAVAGGLGLLVVFILN